MPKSKAFLETTILADSLLKIGSDSDAAKKAVRSYESTFLPVYAIKEFKAGPLLNVSYLHSKLLECKSYDDVLVALARNINHKYQVATCLRLIADLRKRILEESKSEGLDSRYRSLADADRVIYDRLVDETKLLVMKAWLRCETIADSIVDDLPCYVRAAPKVRRNGQYNLDPTTCKVDCCLAADLRSRKMELTKLVSVIKAQPPKRENISRQRVLHELAVRPSLKLKNKDCKALGDAVFALYCPADGDVLTTNISDIRPLTDALGKTTCSPAEVLGT